MTGGMVVYLRRKPAYLMTEEARQGGREASESWMMIAGDCRKCGSIPVAISNMRNRHTTMDSKRFSKCTTNTSNNGKEG